MTREEIKGLGLGAKLRLKTGDVVAVKSINQQDEMITFQYLAMPRKAKEPPTVMPQWGGSTATDPSWVDSQLYGLPTPPVLLAAMTAEIEAEVNTQGTYPTTVTCEWIEIANAVQIE